MPEARSCKLVRFLYENDFMVNFALDLDCISSLTRHFRVRREYILYEENGSLSQTDYRRVFEEWALQHLLKCILILKKLSICL
jgi:hypothetical protein